MFLALISNVYALIYLTHAVHYLDWDNTYVIVYIKRIVKIRHNVKKIAYKKGYIKPHKKQELMHKISILTWDIKTNKLGKRGIFHEMSKHINLTQIRICLPITMNLLPCSSASMNDDQGVASRDNPEAITPMVGLIIWHLLIRLLTHFSSWCPYKARSLLWSVILNLTHD